VKPLSQILRHSSRRISTASQPGTLSDVAVLGLEPIGAGVGRAVFALSVGTVQIPDLRSCWCAVRLLHSAMGVSTDGTCIHHHTRPPPEPFFPWLVALLLLLSSSPSSFIPSSAAFFPFSPFPSHFTVRPPRQAPPAVPRRRASTAAPTCPIPSPTFTPSASSSRLPPDASPSPPLPPTLHQPHPQALPDLTATSSVVVSCLFSVNWLN
jgi:hypothetical protein